MRIAVDIDDTLNIPDRAGVAGAYIARNHLPFRLKEEHANVLVKVYDWEEDDVVRFIKSGGISVFLEARARKGAAETLGGWIRDGLEVVILTARRKSWFGNPESISRDWLEKRQIPYSSLVIEENDKGAYCAEHHISVLVDDNLENCLGAQAHGVYAVLAIGKCNGTRANEIYFGSGSWSGLDRAVRRIVTILQWEERLARACPSRDVRVQDGWEYRKDVWLGRQGNCVRPVLPSVGLLAERIAENEKRGVFRYRLTECDAALDGMLAERGYAVEAGGACMVCTIPSFVPQYKRVKFYDKFDEWTKIYRAVSGESGVLKAYSYLDGRPLFAVIFENEVPVAVGMAVFEEGGLTLFDVCVKQDCRKRGLGSGIVCALLGTGAMMGVKSACAQTEGREAQAFFEHLGFQKAYDYRYRMKEKEND